MEIRVLGPVEFWRAGKRVTAGLRKERLLLGVLALDVNRVVSTTRLMDLVWPDDPPPTARNTLHADISRLRRLIGQDRGFSLDTAGAGYRLCGDPLAVDAHRFRALVRTARTVDDAERRTDLLRTALGLWHGPALAGVTSERCRVRLSHGLEEARLAAIEDLCEARLHLGQHRDVVEELVDLTATHPARERLAAQLMVALYYGGRVADAVQVFRTTRHFLADEYGVDPGHPLESLYLRILRRQPVGVGG